METTTPKNKIAELTRLYTDGSSIDQEIFAEQRSNLLLYAGEHYNKRYSSFYRRIRDSKELSQEQKLRLTKNHTQYICDVYTNNIIGPNPGVGVSPKNEKEVHDQKVSQLHHSVWRDAHERYKLSEKISDWADSFVQIGEVAVKVYFDPNKGKIKAYNQKVAEDGTPIHIDQLGAETSMPMSPDGIPHEPAQDKENPIYEGEFCFEQIYGFNLIRPAETKELDEAPWLCIRKMVDKPVLVAQFPEFKEKIVSGSDETYNIFDITRGGYTKSKDQCLVLEYYFKPSKEYPDGHFYITTKELILHEDDLPGGLFPIIFKPFRKFPTTPRGRSPIKTIRPFQAELNRLASKAAEHSITLGDDKLLLMHGTKVSSGVQIPGIRSVNYSGMKPEILPGRDGGQFLPQEQAIRSELYQIMGVQDALEEMPSQLDPYVMLFRSAQQKKKFQRYTKSFGDFLVDTAQLYLRLAKIHLPDDAVIHAVGSTERVNIQEFRSMDDLCYEINLEPQTDDIETKLGKQIVLNHALQYVGSQLKPEDIGKLMRQMPYANFDESFDDLTINYDNAVNDILALDRGEKPPVNQYDDHLYSIKKLTNRMRKGDFKYLRPEIQQAYAEKVSLHQKFEAQNQTAIQRAEQGIIPTGGYLVVSDLYVSDPANPNKTQRVRLPSEAMQWLIKQLESQQSALAPIAALSHGNQAQIADQVTQMTNQPSGGGQTSPMAIGNQPSPAQGNGMPPRRF